MKDNGNYSNCNIAHVLNGDIDVDVIEEGNEDEWFSSNEVERDNESEKSLSLSVNVTKKQCIQFCVIILKWILKRDRMEWYGLY
jgi:hypothetical protein